MQSVLMKIINNLTVKVFVKIIYRIFCFRIKEGWTNLLGQFFRLGIMWIIIYWIIHWKYEAWFLILYYEYFNKIWQSINELSQVTSDFIMSKYSISRMMDVLNEPIRIANEKWKVNFNKK